MKKVIYKIMSVIILVCMMCPVTGCSNNDKKDYTVYYVNKEGDKLVEQTYSTDTQGSQKLAEELIKQMNTKQKQNDIEVIKPDNLNIVRVSVQDNTVFVFFSKEYNDMNSSTELLYRAGMVKMLTQIQDINFVRFYADDADIVKSDGSILGIMSTEDFVEDSKEFMGDIEWKNMSLYFANKAGDKLVKTTVAIPCSKNVSPEKVLVEKLIAGPVEDGTYSTLPPDTKLLSVSVNNGVCYVNFDSSFLTDMVNVSNEIPIYSVVNSLCQLDNVNSVRIMVNGDSSKMFRENIKLENKFTYNADIIEHQ